MEINKNFLIPKGKKPKKCIDCDKCLGRCAIKTTIRCEGCSLKHYKLTHKT